MSYIEIFDKVEKKYSPSPQMGSKDNQLAIRDIPTILKTSLDRVGSTLDRVGSILIKVFLIETSWF